MRKVIRYQLGTNLEILKIINRPEKDLRQLQMILGLGLPYDQLQGGVRILLFNQYIERLSPLNNHTLYQNNGLFAEPYNITPSGKNCLEIHRRISEIQMQDAWAQTQLNTLDGGTQTENEVSSSESEEEDQGSQIFIENQSQEMTILNHDKESQTMNMAEIQGDLNEVEITPMRIRHIDRMIQVTPDVPDDVADIYDKAIQTLPPQTSNIQTETSLRFENIDTQTEELLSSEGRQPIAVNSDSDHRDYLATIPLHQSINLSEHQEHPLDESIVLEHLFTKNSPIEQIEDKVMESQSSSFIIVHHSSDDFTLLDESAEPSHDLSFEFLKAYPIKRKQSEE